MVSKITRKSPIKSIKSSPNASHPRPRKSSSSPFKTLSSAVISIGRSLQSCRRRLVKIFACLAILHTPKKRKQGFRRLGPPRDDIWNTGLILPSASALPPPSIPRRKTLILDLDETLIHSCAGIPPEHHDFTVYPPIDGQEMAFYVLKRPGVDELLRTAAKSFEVVIFTAGVKEYASLVIDRLDPYGEMISHRLYRDSCKEVEGGKLVKDLSGLGRDLGKVVIVDDNPGCYALQKENALPVTPFVSDLGDMELRRVIQFLDVAGSFEDTREAVAFYLSGEQRTLQ